MASLREAVKDWQDELRAGIAWVAFWREGRSWSSDYIYLEMDDTLTPEDRERLQEIQSIDPAAVVLNGYYCGYLGEDMNLAELTAGVRRHYESGYNNIADFIEAHDNTLSPELIEEAREAAHAAGLPFSEKPYRDGDFDPYTFDGSMSVEDYELMHRMMNEERSDRVNEVFSILIDSRSRAETGEPGGAWLSLPATAEQLHAAMQSVGITADNPQNFFINGYSYPDGKRLALPYDMVCAAGIDELNFLAVRLETLESADLDALNAAAQRKKGFENIGQIIDYTYNVDFFVHIPEVQTAQDLGDYYLNKSGMVDMPEEWKKGIDLAAFGRNAAEHEPGSFTPYGYIVESGDKWERHFEGRDVPEEYRIMSYPQPPARPDPEKVEMDAAATGQAQATQPTAELPQPRPVVPIVLTSEKPAEKVKEITDRLEQGIAELFDSERYKEYLRVMSKFHNYSFRNTLLIAMQAPDASLVAGFSTWKNTHGRNVKRGEKGIKIFAPSPYKIKREMEKIDPQTQKPVIGKDGKPVTEEKEITVPAYKVVSVFDVSQTEGREIPSIGADELTGDVDRYKDFFAALEKTSPVPIGFENIEGSSHGYYHLEEKRIAIQEGMSELQTLKTAIHEIAHAKLHDIDLNAPKEEQGDRPDRRTREVQAESVAYTVCQHYGLDTSDYSFGYVAGWSSGKELSELKSSLETIRAAAVEIIDSIDANLAELQQAREAEQEAAPDLTAEPTVTIIWSESAELHDGETMPLSRANTLFASLDEAQLASPGFDKTKFAIDCVMDGQPEHYEGRQDFGDGEGSLIDHIEKYHAYYENNAEWDNHLLHNEGKEALEADKAYRAVLLHEFVPYLKLHCALSEMEQAATAALQSGESLTPTETAVQAYVAGCREKLNSGDYELPPAPRLADFDAELQAYKEHVKEEIAQEAAAAGMTVEEYAANGYEPYPAPEQPPQEETPVFDKLSPEQQQELSGEVKATLQMLIDADIQASGEVTADTLEAIATQGYAYRDGNLVKQDATEQQEDTGDDFSDIDPAAVREALAERGIENGQVVNPEKLESDPFIQQVTADVERLTQEQTTAEPQPPTAEKPEASVTYYPINEDAARRAKEAMSYSDYRPGSATAEYRHYVDKAAELAARQKKRVDPSFHGKIDGLLDAYARKLAANMNKGYEIAARVPSIMIAGPANFPVRQKEKQNAAADKNMQEFSEIQELLSKIRSTGMGGISADDPNAISKLQSKLAKREALQETMKAVNAYYRKHKTVDGCPHLTAAQIEAMKASLSSDWRANPKPFETYQLSNNNAEIRRLKERIATLTRQKEVGYVGWEFDGGKVEANAGDNRLQIFFDEKPDGDTRDKLKEYGFKWSPSA
ncbi:antirestriction protein ArdA, partial [Clostridioides difficile]|nr:antirestriction protein ArdA [Clostridioides difficile]